MSEIIIEWRNSYTCYIITLIMAIIIYTTNITDIRIGLFFFFMGWTSWLVGTICSTIEIESRRKRK
jgi:hypothetical protein